MWLRQSYEIKGEIGMSKKVKVSLGCKSQIVQFINMNSKSACEIDVQDGHSYIDGKSNWSFSNVSSKYIIQIFKTEL